MSINKYEDFGKECEALEINRLLSGIVGFKYLFSYLLSSDLSNLLKDQFSMCSIYFLILVFRA